MERFDEKYVIVGEDKVTCFLTPTGGRQQGLSLLGEYVNAQTYQDDATWIIVDDCEPVSFMPQSRFSVLFVDPPWRWKLGQNTQGKSLLEGLKHVPGDAKLLILEDDDCYLTDYVQTMVDALDDADLVGERVSRYYNVKARRYREMTGHGEHASLMCTAMKGAAIEEFKKVCGHGHRIDITLWRNFKGSKKLLESRNAIGIKGLPGRAGIGVGHRPNFGNQDNDDRILKEWAGDYAGNY